MKPTLEKPLAQGTLSRFKPLTAAGVYFLMIPVFVPLFLAASEWVFKFDVKEFSYFVILLFCWGLFTTIYFLLRKNLNIRLIPFSAFILVLLSVYGPLSAFSVCEYSQQQVLIRIFEKYGAYKDGKLLSVTDKKVTKKDKERAEATLIYLVENHDLTSLQPFIDSDLKVVADSIEKVAEKTEGDGEFREFPEPLKAGWAIGYLGLSHSLKKVTIRIFEVKSNDMTDVKGFDYITDTTDGTDTVIKSHGGITFKHLYDKVKSTYTLTLNGEKVVFEINPLIKKLLKYDSLKTYKVRDHPEEYSVPKEMLELQAESKSYIVVFKAQYIVNDSQEISDNNANRAIGNFCIRKKNKRN